MRVCVCVRGETFETLEAEAVARCETAGVYAHLMSKYSVMFWS